MSGAQCISTHTPSRGGDGGAGWRFGKPNCSRAASICGIKPVVISSAQTVSARHYLVSASLTGSFSSRERTQGVTSVIQKPESAPARRVMTSRSVRHAGSEIVAT